MLESVFMTLAGAFLYRQVAHEGLLGKVFEEQFAENALKVSELVLHSVRDTLHAGKLPSNHDLRRAGLDSFRKAGIVLADALACELDPKLKTQSWSSRLRRRLIDANLLTDCSSPEMAWVQRLIGALKDKDKLRSLGDAVLQVGADATGLLDETVDVALASELHKQFAEWATHHASVHGKPVFFENFVFKGWPVDQGTLTLYQVYCLFFREHIKRDPAVFGIFAGNTLALIQQQLHGLAQTKPLDQAKLSAALQTELSTVVDRQLGGLHAWLDTQLSQIQDVLEDISEVLRILEQQGAQTQELIRERLPPSLPLQDDSITAQFSAHIKAILDEADQLVSKGRYSEAKDKLSAARQAAETENCQPAVVHALVEIAEVQLLQQRDIDVARDALREYLREASEDRQPKQRLSILILLGDAESHLDNFEEAKSVFQNAIQLAQKHKDKFREARSLVGLSHVEEMLGNLKEANHLLDEASRLFRDESREAKGEALRRTKINLGAVLSTKAVLLRHEAKVNEALICVTKAEAIFREVKSLDNLGRTLTVRAELLLQAGNRKVGHQVLLDALSTFESIGNIHWQCRCLEDLATLYFTGGDDAEATVCIGRTLHLVVSGRPENEAVHYFLKLGHLCLNLEEPEKAGELIHRAKGIAAGAGDDQLLAECLVAEARTIKGKQGRAERAELFQQAIQHLESARLKCEVKGRRAVFTRQIGDLYGRLGRIHEAQTCFEQALHEFEELGDAAGQSGCLGSLAAIAREQQSPGDAAKSLERVIAFTEGKPLDHDRAGAFHDLGMLRLSQGDIAETKRCLDMAKSLAEKHGFRDVLDALTISERHLDHSKRVQQPPSRNLPSLIRELHRWCERYPKMSQAILPLWYWLYRTELWGITRSLLGVKFLICAVDSPAFRIAADILRRQGDLYVWGIDFAIKTKPKGETIPFPDEMQHPAHVEFLFFEEEPTDLNLAAHAIYDVMFRKRKNRYLWLPSNEFPGVTSGYTGPHIRLAPKIYKMMLETPAESLIDDKRICLPLSEQCGTPDIRRIMLIAWENSMLPIVSEHLPHSDHIKAVCDVSLDIPNATGETESVLAAAEAGKELWSKLLASCPAAPQSALSEFSKGMTRLVTGLSSENRMAARVYVVQFRSRTQEVFHPVVVIATTKVNA